MTESIPSCVSGSLEHFSGFGGDCSGGCALCGLLHCHTRLLNRNQHAFHQRDMQTRIHWVRSGLLRLYQTLANGKRQIIGFAFPGEFVDLATKGQYRFSAQAVAETELRTMARPAFENAARANARLSFELFSSVSASLTRSAELALTIGQRTSESSLAAFLLEMDARTQAGVSTEEETIYLPMPRTDIADYLGLTAETISRTFTKFSRGGLISLCRRRGVRLLDRSALEHLAEGLPAAQMAW